LVVCLLNLLLRIIIMTKLQSRLGILYCKVINELQFDIWQRVHSSKSISFPKIFIFAKSSLNNREISKSIILIELEHLVILLAIEEVLGVIRFSQYLNDHNNKLKQLIRRLPHSSEVLLWLNSFE
jgi:hypothetical protein